MNFHKIKDDENEIIPDGGSIRVSIMAMDSVQRKVANQPALDQRVRDNLAAGRATLKAMQSDFDRVAAWADHFSAERKQAAADADTPYATYCQRLSNDWQAVA